jgi:drug/metabolite transporter (DMT)-like permease
MKLLGILLIAVGVFMYVGAFSALAGYSKGAVDFVSFLSPLLPIGLGTLALRKVKADNIKKNGFTL